MTFVIAVVITVSAFVAGSLVWRAVSRRRSLPCPAWLGWMVDNPLSKHRTARTIRHLGLSPGMVVLDAGCGPGRLIVPIAQAVGPDGGVLAADIQPEMLRRARAKADRASVHNAQFLQAGLGEGKLPASHFDRAVLVTVLGEIPDRLAALLEIHAALKSGGFLLVSEVMGDPHYQSVGTVKALAAEAGFRSGVITGNRFAFSIKLERP